MFENIFVLENMFEVCCFALWLMGMIYAGVAFWSMLK